MTIDDDCPLPWERRWIAHEAQTIGAALEFVACSDHVLSAPVLAARRLLAAGVLVEVPVVGWEVREPVHVLCNGGRVLSRVRDIVVRAVRSAINGEVSSVSLHAVRGRVVKTTTEGGAEHIEALSQRYTGGPYAWYGGRDQVRMILTIAAEKIHQVGWQRP